MEFIMLEELDPHPPLFLLDKAASIFSLQT